MTMTFLKLFYSFITLQYSRVEFFSLPSDNCVTPIKYNYFSIENLKTFHTFPCKKTGNKLQWIYTSRVGI